MRRLHDVETGDRFSPVASFLAESAKNHHSCSGTATRRRRSEIFLCRLVIGLGFPISLPFFRPFGVGLYENRALPVFSPEAVTRTFWGT
jgi:hypothetical protein